MYKGHTAIYERSVRMTTLVLVLAVVLALVTVARLSYQAGRTAAIQLAHRQVTGMSQRLGLDPASIHSELADARH